MEFMKQLIQACADLFLLFLQGPLQLPVILGRHFNQCDIGLDRSDLQPQTVGQETSQMTLDGKRYSFFLMTFIPRIR